MIKKRLIYRVILIFSVECSFAKKKVKEASTSRDLNIIESPLFISEGSWGEHAGNLRWSYYARQCATISETLAVPKVGSIFYWTDAFVLDSLIFPVFNIKIWFALKQAMLLGCGSIRGWRAAHGYPTRGQRTHSNAKASKRNRLLVTLLVDSFVKEFGSLRKPMYATLAVAEATNTLWYFTWGREWSEAAIFVYYLCSSKGNANRGMFNPILLASNQVNGFTRYGKAAKKGKSKKATQHFTVGVPLFFSRWVFCEKPLEGFEYKLRMSEQVKRIMTKKKRKFIKWWDQGFLLLYYFIDY